MDSCFMPGLPVKMCPLKVEVQWLSAGMSQLCRDFDLQSTHLLPGNIAL